ncbi:MAG: DUF1295 domain-containing protein [Planctomycetota bacterium]|jgi:steroid 5-alpha reductase family enzyme
MMTLTGRIALAWGAMALIMAALWLFQRSKRNAGIVDVAWSFGTGLAAVWFAATAAGPGARRLLVAALAGIWGFRLGVYLYRRVSSEAEDGRYRALREKWGEKTQRNLFVFFQLQAFWAVLFAAPMLVAAENTAPAPGIGDLVGALVWLVAMAGEWTADRQLARFRSDPGNAGQVCREGLWRYSRHPNYFFEWVHWWAYVAIGVGGPFGWLTLAGPAVMLLFLTKITGIPPTESRALRSLPPRKVEA